MSVIDQVQAGFEQPWDPAPGVDIVMPLPDGVGGDILDRWTLRLVGALHRRFWARRRDLLAHRATNTETSATNTETSTHCADDEMCWADRIAQHQALSDAIVDRSDDNPERLVIIRGWESSEPGVLVDGRAVPGCIFDLAVALSTGADAFRRGEDPFAVEIPQPLDDEETSLWNDLVDLAHDRAGIDRGTVRILTS